MSRLSCHQDLSICVHTTGHSRIAEGFQDTLVTIIF